MKTKPPRKLVHAMSDRERYFLKTGNRYGYPICCVMAFIEDAQELEATGKIASRDNPGMREKWSFQGFVPCEKHADFIAREGYAAMAEKINKHRSFLYPFPVDEQLLGDVVKMFMQIAQATVEAGREHTTETPCVCPECQTSDSKNPDSNGQNIKENAG